MAEGDARHILIATNGSPAATAAARYLGEVMPAGSVARLSVVSVVPTPLVSAWVLGSAGAISQDAWNRLNDAALQAAANAVAAVDGMLDGLADETIWIIRRGAPAQEIVRAASEADADLIVLGDGPRGWRALLTGGVAGRVVRLARCPVLVVPAPRPAPRLEPAQPAADHAPSEPRRWRASLPALWHGHAREHA